MGSSFIGDIDGLVGKMTKQKKHVVILGCPAVGKLTTAKILSKKLNYPLFDNAKIIDLVSLLHSYGSEEHKFYRNELRFDFYKRAALCRTIDGLISTNVLRTASNWNQFYKIKDSFDYVGWKTFFILLKAKESIVLERVEEKSRLSKMVFHKTADLKEWFLRNKNYSTPLDDRIIVVDNSYISAEEASKIIIGKINEV